MTPLQSTTRRSCAPVLAALAAIAVPSTAFGQERVELFTFLNGQSRVVEVDATVRGFGAVTDVTPMPAGVPSPDDFAPKVVAGGRFVVWSEGGGIFALDRRTRTVLNAAGLLPYPGYLGLRLLEVDSHRPRLFVSGQGFSRNELVMIDLRGAAPVRLGTSPLLISDAAYAAEPDELFYLEAAFENSLRVTWVVVVDATTGHERRRWKRDGFVTAIRTDPSGRLLWIDDGGLTALDAATGAVLATSNQFSARLATVDVQRGLLLVRQGDFLVVVDPLRLTEIGRARVAFTPPDPVVARTAETLPGRWMTGAYTVRTETRITLLRSGRVGREDVVEKTCQTIDIDALNPNGTKRETADVLTPLGGGHSAIGERGSTPDCRAIAVLVRSPFAPAALASSVAGNTVDLSWQDPGDTTEFELEFGFTPGQRAGALRVGQTARVAIPAVPPGVYYVRVKALNEVGPSPASNEVRVVVP